MTIQIEVVVTGTELGRHLANDPEELAYALLEMSEWDGEELGKAVAQSMPWGHGAVVAAFLRAIADAVEKE